MSWSTPRTWTTSELVTASIMNTHVRDNENYLYGAGALRLDSVTSPTSFNTSTAENTLYSFSVPANTPSTTRLMRFLGFVVIATDGGGTRTVNLRVKFGGTTWLSGDLSYAANTTHYLRVEVLIFERNATNVQRVIGTIVSASTAAGSAWSVIDAAATAVAGTNGTVDTTSAQTFALTAQMGASNASFSTALEAGIFDVE